MGFVEKPGKSRRVLIAEDNEDDYLLTRDAFLEAGLPVELLWVKDGEELMDFLKRDIPELILLDLNMPKKNGKEALAEIKSNKRLKRVPVVAFSTSGSDHDVQSTFDLGINSYIQKPVGFDRYVRVLTSLYQYWFETSRIPSGQPTGRRASSDAA